MPTISQLPSADTVSAADLIPISQGGSAHAISVGALLAQTQPAIMVGPPSLLGRFSVGSGGPDPIALGAGLTINNGTLSSGGLDFTSLPLQTTLSASDQVVVNNAGTPLLLDLEQLRELFTAGSNITIDASGTISASASGGGTAYSLTTLPSVATLAAGDLVGVSQSGSDHTITYGNFLDGLTIDLAQPANSATDTDTFWVAQTGNMMARQTLGALWPWLVDKLPSWKQPVMELTANTTLDWSSHNNAVLVCSSPIQISALAANLESGFSCELINVSSGSVTFSQDILTSNGGTGLSPFQSGTIRCVTYSNGTTIYASISAGGSATSTPGQASGLTASSVTSTGLGLSWSAPSSGGTASVYSIEYRVTGSTPWLLAGQTNGPRNFTISGLQPTTSYDFTVSAANNIGSGPASATFTVTTTS
jgi:hypothetical protein